MLTDEEYKTDNISNVAMHLLKIIAEANHGPNVGHHATVEGVAITRIGLMVNEKNEDNFVKTLFSNEYEGNSTKRFTLWLMLVAAGVDMNLMKDPEDSFNLGPYCTTKQAVFDKIESAV